MSRAAIRSQVLALLGDWQQPDGSFAGRAGADPVNFKPQKQQPTIFPTILILDALANIPEADDIAHKAAQYVLKQQHQQGSWNYWDRSSQAAQAEPYPDDLDDTACAMAALHKVDTSLISSEQVGALARLLVASEIRPGGPYNTWLIDYQKYTQWRHVDVAVNANVGYVLAQHGAAPEGLIAYLTECITEDRLTSDYYVGRAPVLYFLSRWYVGPALHVLRQAVRAEIKKTDKQKPLELALLALAAMHVGIAQSTVSPLLSALQKLCTKEGWPAAALYVDPVYDGAQHYGGSAALTTAYALQALCMADERLPRQKAHAPIANQDSGLRQAAQGVADGSIRRQYLALARQVTASDAGRQITAPATIIAEAGGLKLPRRVLQSLNRGSLNGWIAYTIYDDFLDGRGDPQLLSLANIAHRQSYANYLQALPNNQELAEIVAKTFDDMDSANSWELNQARAKVLEGGELRFQNTPDYTDYGQLARRSWGHSLAASGVMLAAGYDARSPEYGALQAFFKHFLIARQLNDDAHDWEEDLCHGHISAVVALVLADYGRPKRIVSDEVIADMRQVFWRTTISDVSNLIMQHITWARQALHRWTPGVDISELESWLVRLEKSTELAVKTRDETLDFIRGFGGTA